MSKFQSIITPNDTNFCINNHKLSKFNNIISYKYEKCLPKLYIEYHQDINESTKCVYFIFDCSGEDAFAHWIYESFIFIPIFLEIKKMYPNVKILTTNKKKYVRNFFKLWGVDSEIIYGIESNENICFFPPVLSLNDNQIDQVLYEYYIDQYVDKLNQMMPILSQSTELLFLPRNAIDNYIYNQRTIPEIDEIKTQVINKNGSILDTYSINNIYTQFSIIKNSKKIIIDFGSSFLVNCIFLDGKDIIVYSGKNIFDGQYSKFISIKIICDRIFSKNNVKFQTNWLD